jgi:hypothetical protein
LFDDDDAATADLEEEIVLASSAAAASSVFALSKEAMDKIYLLWFTTPTASTISYCSTIAPASAYGWCISVHVGIAMQYHAGHQLFFGAHLVCCDRYQGYVNTTKKCLKIK